MAAMKSLVNGLCGVFRGGGPQRRTLNPSRIRSATRAWTECGLSPRNDTFTSAVPDPTVDGLGIDQRYGGAGGRFQIVLHSRSEADRVPMLPTKVWGHGGPYNCPGSGRTS